MDISGVEPGFYDEPHDSTFDDLNPYDGGLSESPYDDPPVDDAPADGGIGHMTSVAEDYPQTATTDPTTSSHPATSDPASTTAGGYGGHGAHDGLGETISVDFGGQGYHTQATIDLTHDGRPDAGEIQDQAGNTYLVVDADGDGRADEAGEYDPSGHLIATGHPDAHGVMVADGVPRQISEPVSTTYLVDPRTGEWRTD